ncbi:MAG: diphosphatase [Frankiales bacterium]|nr:diphosphatase [Frankiales bacterium]
MTERRDVPALSRSGVDRDSATREDDAALGQAWERARVLVVDDGSVLVDGTDLVLVGPGDAPEGDRIYLGRDAQAPYFAVAGPLTRRLGTQKVLLRDVGAHLSDRDAGLVSHAVGLTNWHAAHAYCSRCGAPTVAVRGGSVRRCEADGSDHFPRTDPAIIVLVTDGADRCVLGRQSIWPPRRYSTLAGFVEPGESLEQAVVREVGEESGLAVREVIYRDSQPWPFPSSLMLGFRAVCDGSSQPVPHDGELEDVRWFHRDELRDAAGWSSDASGVLLPPPISIAWKLITDWVAEG